MPLARSLMVAPVDRQRPMATRTATARLADRSLRPRPNDPAAFPLKPRCLPQVAMEPGGRLRHSDNRSVIARHVVAALRSAQRWHRTANSRRSSAKGGSTSARRSRGTRTPERRRRARFRPRAPSRCGFGERCRRAVTAGEASKMNRSLGSMSRFDSHARHCATGRPIEPPPTIIHYTGILCRCTSRAFYKASVFFACKPVPIQAKGRPKRSARSP